MYLDLDGIINEEKEITTKDAVKYIENFINENDIDGINKLKITDLLLDLKKINTSKVLLIKNK